MRYSRIITLMSIKNVDVPSCINCKFYKPQYYTTFESPLSDCQAVGELNIVTGKVDYVSVENCRRHECGMNGKLYEPEPHLLSKKINHVLRYTSPYSIPLLFYLFMLFYVCIHL